MQKKLIALAIASAFAAPAFAATSNVDVYGSINVSYDHVDDDSDSWGRMVTNNNSFIGFKGSEDLGGGLSAVWQIEANLEMSGNGVTSSTVGTSGNTGTDGNIFGTRNTYIGLSSKSFGTVLAGVHDTPYKMSTGSLDNFVGTIGDYNAIFGSSPAAANSNFFDLRTGNTFAYVSPNWSGFDFKAAYVMGLEAAETAPSDSSDAWSLSGTYANGPLFVTAAYEAHNSVGTGLCIAGATCLSSGTVDRDAWKVGASYTFGDLKIGALYESIDTDTGLAGGHDAWGINASYKMGAFTFKGAYASAGDVDGTSGVEANDSGADMWAVGADYALSKRTMVQFTYASIGNDTNGDWGMGQGATVSAAGTGGSDVSGFSIGIKHTF